MNDYVQITLNICLTIIICHSISAFRKKDERDNKYYGSHGSGTKDTSRLDEIFDKDRGITICKSPTYPAPPRPGSTEPNISSAKKIKNIKPPSTGSGIK